MSINRPFNYDADGLKLTGWVEITPGQEASFDQPGYPPIADVVRLNLEGYGPILSDHLHPDYIRAIEKQAADSFKRMG